MKRMNVLMFIVALAPVSAMRRLQLSRTNGAWRSSPKMRKFAREWYFPPVPEGFDFATVEPQEKRKEGFYYV